MKQNPFIKFLIAALLLSACSMPTPTPVATEPPVESSVGKVTNYSIKIEPEQGSGQGCGADSTYLVTASITADGIVGAAYEVLSSSSGGQISTGGSFQNLENNGVSESIKDALTFEKAETKTLSWRLTGPYTYPNDITVTIRVNDGEFKSATLNCGSAPQPTATNTAVTTSGCKDSALYVSDDGKDGTVYAPNTPFTKTWKVRNTGTCTWDKTYTVTYVSGATMSQSPTYLILPNGGTVAPGGEVDISIGLTSPPTSGDYRADWKLVNTGGYTLAQFFLTLKVKDQSSSAGKITKIVPQIVLEQGSGTACTNNSTYFVYVDVTTDGPLAAEYRIDLTDGSGQVTNGVFDSGSPEVTGLLTFDAADTDRIIQHVKGPYVYPNDLSVRVYIEGQSPQSVAVSCQ